METHALGRWDAHVQELTDQSYEQTDVGHYDQSEGPAQVVDGLAPHLSVAPSVHHEPDEDEDD